MTMRKTKLSAEKEAAVDEVIRAYFEATALDAETEKRFVDFVKNWEPEVERA